jgi:glycosyltransferase involved in cell wall biosynthesis
MWLIDWLAFKLSNLVLVETNEQKKYLVKKFKIKPEKFARLFTGANDSIFCPDGGVKKEDKFTVLFRGRLLPEAGVKYILEAAKILENENIRFLILGFGLLEKEIRKQIEDLNLKNLKLISERLSIEELRRKMLSAHVGIGQIENHERLERTVPYKASEYLAIKLPYINGNGQGIKELLRDRENCLLVKLADPKDLADKIMELKNDPVLSKKIADNGYELYREKLTPLALGRELLSICSHFVKK